MAKIRTTATDIGQVSINPQGEYSAGTQYHTLDVVTSNGSSYICVKDCINQSVSNTTYWYLLASKGDTYEVTPEDLQAIADQITQDASSAFNLNVTAKTNEFNQNAVDKTTDFNGNATSKTTDFNSNATSKTTDFNNNASSKTDAFDLNATNQTIAFDGNYTDKVGLFNGNATDKTTAFNNNASAKTTEFNENALEKTTEFNENADKIVDQIPQGTATDTIINLTDSSNLPLKEIDLLGNTSQSTNIQTYTCVGTESGDYYFVYDSINYQFTMPTISAGEVLAFNTTTLKLYQGTTEIATTTASTGTLITLNATPNPDYPQDIKVVTGDVAVNVVGKNLFHIDDFERTPQGVNVKCTNNEITYNGTSTAGFYAMPNEAKGQLIGFFKAGTYRISGKYLSGSWSKSTGVDAGYIRKASDLTSSTQALKTIDNFCSAIMNNSSYDLSLTEDCYLYIQHYSNNAGFVFNDFKYAIQIELGSTATTFEPYTGTKITLPLGSIELAKIGDYQDRIYKQDGKWWLEKNIGKVVLNGTQNYTIVELTTVNRFSSYLGSENLQNTQTTSQGFCNQLEIAGGYSTDTEHTYLYNKTLYFFYNKTRAADISSLQAYLTSNNLILYARRATPEITEITDATLISQLESLLASSTYKNITNVYTVTDNEEPTINIVYRKDLETLFNNLTNAIVSLGNNT